MAEDDKGVARLLNEYAQKPPSQHLTAEEKKHLEKFVKQDRTFRKLKDFVRMTAWEKIIPSLNADPSDPDFPVKFARMQGEKEGMLRAIDLLETFVDEEDEENA